MDESGRTCDRPGTFKGRYVSSGMHTDLLQNRAPGSDASAPMDEHLPEGFLLKPDLLTSEEETALIEFIGSVSFGEVRMHGVTAKRRVAQFGWRYSFESYRLTEGPPVPVAFLDVREGAAKLAGVHADEFSEALVTEYLPGAGIGWHRDAPHFGVVAGISLGSACRMRFRTGEVHHRRTAVVELPPRSIYLLTGSARSDWQHMLPPVRQTRWSLTFRTVRRPRSAQPKKVAEPTLQPTGFPFPH